MSYRQEDLVAAINMIASISPRVEKIIWKRPGEEINLDYLFGHENKCKDNTFSGGENRAYEFAISLWGGEARIRLDDVLTFDDQNYMKIIKALMILRGIKKVEVE